jgi:polyhydroxyalkanoate synthesis regulator protein
MQTFVPNYLEAAMESFQRNHSAVRESFGPSMLADIAKRNMAFFEDAAQAFAGKARDDKQPAPAPNKEVDALRAELEALRAKVDRLNR